MRESEKRLWFRQFSAVAKTDHIRHFKWSVERLVPLSARADAVVKLGRLNRTEERRVAARNANAII